MADRSDIEREGGGRARREQPRRAATVLPSAAFLGAVLIALVLAVPSARSQTSSPLFQRMPGSRLSQGSPAPQTEGGPGFSVARLKYDGGGDWYSDPTSLPNLAKALKERTSVPVDRLDEVRVSILDPDFFNYPYVFMNGHGNVRFSEAEIARLRAYLLAGGFLFADDNYGMDKSFRREIARVFPDRKLVDVPYDHPIYHAFYDLPKGPPKVHEHDGLPSEGLGIFDGKRLMVFYTYQTDIGDGIEDWEVHKDPPAVREEAMEMAINTVIYALTRG